MQVLLLTNNLKQAEFIQKGLRYELLSCDILMLFGDFSYVKEKMPLYDGIFLLLNEFELSGIEATLMKLQSGKKLPIFVLLQENCDYIDAIVGDGRVEGVFVRPFPFRNMASDMKYAIFNHKERLRNSRYVLRDLELDLEKHQVIVNGYEINLRNKEFALLHFLLVNAGKVVTRTTILENVWDRNTNILTNTVDVHISQLRKKIERYAKGKFFHTVPCTGYILE